MKLYILMYLDYYTTSGSTETYSDGGILGVFDSKDLAIEYIEEYKQDSYGKFLRLVETELNQPE